MAGEEAGVTGIQAPLEEVAVVPREDGSSALTAHSLFQRQSHQTATNIETGGLLTVLSARCCRM